MGFAQCNGIDVIHIQSGGFMDFNDDDDDGTMVGVVETPKLVQAFDQFTMISTSLLAEVQQNYAWIQQISIDFSSSAPFVPLSPPMHSSSVMLMALLTVTPVGSLANPSSSPSWMLTDQGNQLSFPA